MINKSKKLKLDSQLKEIEELNDDSKQLIRELSKDRNNRQQWKVL